MAILDPKADLLDYLRGAREAVVWKLDGLSEYDARRPLTPTGTNLLGLVKHLARGEFGYFGETFGRPSDAVPRWPEGEESWEAWALPTESRESIVDLYRRAWAHADATIEALTLDAVGRVPWWGDGGDVTLHQMLVHMTAETQRHAGHADIVRELIDGTVGLLPTTTNVPLSDAATWTAHRDMVERNAREAASR
ncbi:DinB family protein [Micromonospora sp. WMMD1128]|uniref:DinB family protein n=1 Tax=Micromonospora sp. WMMD1128 TaxID=3015150 RepID=UPI00248AF49B|nr:DinB family protein [Micromonospora sp. WMMD1128]WBB75054.1 DinB family protein [Micromonospora sp. WMMD1128]